MLKFIVRTSHVTALVVLFFAAFTSTPIHAEEEGTVKKTAKQLERGTGSLLGAIGQEIKKVGEGIAGSGKEDRKDDQGQDKSRDDDEKKNAH